MKTFNLILITMLYGGCLSLDSAQGQSNIQNIVDQYFDQRDQYESLIVEVEFRNKSFSKDDTTVIAAMTETVCVPSDTLFGGHLFMLTESKAYAYNGKTSYFGDYITSTVEINALAKNPGSYYIHDWARNFIESSFLTKNQEGRAMLNDPDYKHTVCDTMIGRWPCKGLQFLLPNMEEFTDLKVFVAFDTIDYMLRHRSISMWFQENEQYQSWTYYNPQYGHNTSLTKLDDNFLSSFTHQILEEDIVAESTNPEPGEIDYSVLRGRLLETKDTFDIRNIDKEIIVLDFWYSACYPCIKSIPEVNKIFNRFDDGRVAVYGVNIIDYGKEHSSRMEKYIRNNPMAYPTIMAEQSMYKHWVNKGYPALLVLDSNYELIKEHTGFTENLADEIGETIQAHLDDQ